MKKNAGKLTLYSLLATTQVVFAFIIFLNELYAINNRFPGGNFPIEHEFSWAKVFLFCSIAILGPIMVVFLRTRKDPNVFLPSLNSVLFLAAFLTLIGILVSYKSFAAWCCGGAMESVRYFGFPFSYMRGNSLLEILSNFNMRFNFLPYQFFLDLLFWLNTIFVALSLTHPLIHKVKITQQSDK